MSEPVLINRDEEHLRLLTIFHYVCAGLAALFACIPIIHLVLGLVMVFAPHIFGPGKNQPPQFLGLFFVGFAMAIIALGWTFAALLAWTGRCLARRVHYTFCFVMACVACCSNRSERCWAYSRSWCCCGLRLNSCSGRPPDPPE